MGDVFRLYIPSWAVCRAALALGPYLGLVFVWSFMVCVTPAQALISTTGYARVASQAAFNAYRVASASLAVTTLSPALAAASTGSVALRLVAGPVGWASLGVSAGLVLGQVFYSNAQVQQIQAAAAPSAGFTWSAYTGPGTITGVTFIGSFPIVTLGPVGGDLCVNVWQGRPAGWSTGSYSGQCALQGPANTPANQLPQPNPTAPATPAQIQTYLGGLPATDPNSLTSNTTQVGVGVDPQSATSVVTQTVDPASLPTTVVPAASVPSTSVVVDPSAPAPAGPQTTNTTQTSTSTTTTTTDPQTGVTTTQTQDEAVSSCTAGSHDSRSFGTILQTHIEMWKGSGIAGALTTLRTLTWPSASPTYTLNSGLLGTFTFDFNAWNGILLALRSLIIAGASFAAYRIIFVGGSAGVD